ncbi:MAG TPA: heavy metal translocating P-type ATPase [Pseudomonas sp.]|jgi:heavy metal translocating P-type ATPase|uniref:heavy metal translocating P-type ATPase n=1 Tax=Pseudomonas sp. TaxID=306 RepID=UPI002EDA2E02
MKIKGWTDPALLGLTVLTLLAGAAYAWAGRMDWSEWLWNASALIVAALLLVEILMRLYRREVGVDLIALLAILGAIALGQALVAVVIALMLQVGRSLEYYTSQRAERELSQLIDRAPRHAWRLRGDALEQVPVDDIVPGDCLMLRMGEVVAVDGTLLDADATLDESALTGEPLPVRHVQGQAIRSGSLNAGAPFILQATHQAAQSTYAAIVRMAASAKQSRAPFMRLADRYALALIPLTLLIAGIAWWASGDPLRALAVLVVATPCPLILAVPVAIIGGISRCAHRGILIKDGATLEALAGARILLLDKTGTLTAGHPVVQSMESAGIYSSEQLWFFAGSLAQASPHPISLAIVQAAKAHGAALSPPRQIEEIPGAGLSGQVDGHHVKLGSHAYVTRPDEQSWTQALLRRMDYQVAGGSFIAVDNVTAGAALFADQLRLESPHALRLLRQNGIQRVIMLTGDRQEAAQMIGQAAGVDEVRAGLDPAQKVAAVTQARQWGKTLMVGDGVNDAPALAAADVGVALGASGATASSQVAGVVLLVDRLDRVAEALRIARRSRRIAVQGVLAGMGLSVLAMLAAALGYLPPLYGAILQELIDVATILNALRALGGGSGSQTKDALSGERMDDLQQEHDALQSLLQEVHALASQATHLSTGQLRVELQRLLPPLQERLIPHEQHDENTLYPLLARQLKGDDPLSAMSYTHREIFRLVSILSRMNTDLGRSDTGVTVDEIQQQLMRLDTVLSLHFANENELYHNLDTR